VSALRSLCVLAALALNASASVAAQSFNWDALGAEFCALSTAGDLAGLVPLISPSLAQELSYAYGRAGAPIPPTVFQSYTNVVPVCEAKTRNAALVEIKRSGPRGAAPSWTEYLVVAPEADGTTRIDDVLFATRRSDTLRARLRAIAD
jgi:hypothetical protein